MRVGLITPGFSAHTDDWCIPALRDLARGLSRAGYQLHVLALRYPYKPGRYHLCDVEVTALGGGRGQRWKSLRLWQQTLKAIGVTHRRQPFDLLHAFWATESGALAALAGRLWQIPTIVSLAGGELVGLRDIGYGSQLVTTERWKVWLALRLAGAITAGSRKLIQRARPWLGQRPADHVRRIPLGVDLNRFHPEPGARQRQGPTRLIHVGSLIPIKDQAMLLRALAHLQDQGFSCELQVAGQGPLRENLEERAQALELGKSVRFLGQVPHHHLPLLYQGGAVLAVSSRYEAQSMVTLEAAACGLPVVGTAVGVVPEFAPDAGIAVPVGDAVSMADALATVLGDPDRERAMSQEAQALAASEFSLARCIERFGQLYAELASSH
jgi:glycosyltransferase involved in cell wall biosynthesis